MRIDLQCLPVPLSSSCLLSRTVVVIDVLRATSVIVQALSQGALEIIPVITVEEAFRMAKELPAGTVLLGGERKSQRIEGFDLGNSPGEYLSERVRNKRIIFTTTNGTKAFHSVSSGKEVFAGSFFNVGALARRCAELRDDLLIYPAGDEGRFALEDVVCGGMLIDRIRFITGEGIEITDAGLSALLLYQRFKADLTEAFRLSAHGRDLIRKGLEEDLALCARIDITEVVPLFREGVIRPAGEDREKRGHKDATT